MSYLLPIERIIIESLNRSPKSLDAIATDLGVNAKAIFFTLQRLAIDDLIISKNQKYSLNLKNQKVIAEKLDNPKSKKYEIKSILESAKDCYLENGNEESLNIKKVYLTPSDSSTIESLLSQINQFLESKSKNTKGVSIEKKKIFYWGQQSYKDILNYLEY